MFSDMRIIAVYKLIQSVLLTVFPNKKFFIGHKFYVDVEKCMFQRKEGKISVIIVFSDKSKLYWLAKGR